MSTLRLQHVQPEREKKRDTLVFCVTVVRAYLYTSLSRIVHVRVSCLLPVEIQRYSRFHKEISYETTQLQDLISAEDSVMACIGLPLSTVFPAILREENLEIRTPQKEVLFAQCLEANPTCFAWRGFTSFYSDVHCYVDTVPFYEKEKQCLLGKYIEEAGTKHDPSMH